jgi:hypothetical protein
MVRIDIDSVGANELAVNNFAVKMRIFLRIIPLMGSFVCGGPFIIFEVLLNFSLLLK